MSTLPSFDSTIHSLYLAFYGRPADPAGLKFWSQQLAKTNGDPAAIIDAFSTSAEATVRFATESTEQRIADIYHQLFNRAPDAAGLAYWLDAVESGRVSMAGVAIAILEGAQGSDHSLVELRQQAVAKFTEQVEASGSDYSGFASVEAARVLVRGVTLDASGADIDALVKAAVSFADTATKTPAVVEAIATGSTLQALYDTVRGSADPVALTQTLADTAKAAAGNPATLDSLLRGGGMAQVLEVMPAAATLQDVVDALATGGLPAAVEVVYPTAPTAPAAPTFSLQFAFKEVTQGSGDTHADNVTNVAKADVKFSYTGTGLKAGQHVEYSVDGGATWSKDGITVSSADHSVVIAGVDLEQGAAASSGSIVHIMNAVENLPNLLTTVSVRAVDAGGATTTPVSQQIVYDHFAGTPRIALVDDTAGAEFGNGYDMITRDGSYTVGRIEAGATVEYLLNDSTTWTKDAPMLAEGENVLAVHQIDAAGNVSGTALATIIVDTKAPAAPTIALVTDSGTDGDGITAVGKVAITGLDTDIGTAWEYSTNGGETWTFGQANDGSGTAELPLTAAGDQYVLVRQVDPAGNVGVVSNQIAFTLDGTAPDGSFAFKYVEQPDISNTAVTALASASVYFEYSGDPAADDLFQYRVDGGDWITLGTDAYDSQAHLLATGKVDLSQADRTVEVRAIDKAGNEGQSAGVLVDSTVNDKPLAEKSVMTGVKPVMGNAPILYFTTDQYHIQSTGDLAKGGLANNATLTLESLAKGTPSPVDNYFDGPGFGVQTDSMMLDAKPKLDFYRMSWQDDTFHTDGPSGQGYVAAGETLFVAGYAGQTVVEGFNVQQIAMVRDDVSQPNSQNANTAYIDTGNLEARIHTGGGNDLVTENGSKLTIVYDSFDPTATDVILGYDVKQDAIELNGSAAIQADTSRDGSLYWVAMPGMKLTANASMEGVRLYTDGYLSTSLDNSAVIGTLNTLNGQLNVANLVKGDHLLILAGSGSHSSLIWYEENNGDGMISAGEYSFIAVFADANLTTADIQLVGSATATP